MNKGWLKNLVAFLGLISLLGTVYLLLFPRAPAPATSVAAQVELDARLETERKSIVEFVVARTQAAEGKLDTINSTLNDFKTETRETLKKLDDRLFEMQREKSASNSESDAAGG